MAAPNEIKLPLRRKKQKMDLASLGHKGTSVEEPWSKFSPEMSQKLKTLTLCLTCFYFIGFQMLDILNWQRWGTWVRLYWHHII